MREFDGKPLLIDEPIAILIVLVIAAAIACFA